MASARVAEPEGRAWPFDRRFRALTYAFAVRTDLTEVAPVLDRLLASFSDPAEGGRPVPTYTLTHRVSPGTEEDRRRRPYELFHDGESVQRVSNPGSMLDWVIIDSTRRAVREDERFVAVHAGVVSLHERAVLMPAPPDSGKTTLTAGLTRAGFDFLGDEVALLDPETGWVHPYPRPLLIEPRSMGVLDGLASELSPEHEALRHLRYQVAAEDLRTGSMGAACPVALVVLPTYRPASATRLQPISRATAMVRLAEQTFNRRRMGARGITTLGRVVTEAACYGLTVGDLATAIAGLRRVLDGSTVAAR